MITTVEEFEKAYRSGERFEGDCYTYSEVTLNFGAEHIVVVSYSQEKRCPIVDVRDGYTTTEIELRGLLLKAFEAEFAEYLIGIPDYHDIHEYEIPF